MNWFRKSDSAAGPDFTQVDSREKAEALAREGTLAEMLLLPEEFGGERIPPNIIHVPPFAAELKRSTDLNVIMPLAREGKITRYNAEPQYSGSSFVPTSIKLFAHDPGSFTWTIRIWGDEAQA